VEDLDQLAADRGPVRIRHRNCGELPSARANFPSSDVSVRDRERRALSYTIGPVVRCLATESGVMSFKRHRT